MSCLFSFKFLFALIGWRLWGGRGLFFGFLIGWLIDSMYRRPTIRFTSYTFHSSQTPHTPYVDVTLQEAYRTLGLSEAATDEEVRQAYRQLALRYHPDRFAAQGEAAKAEAEKNFREATEARDIIFRARGL